MSDPRVPVRPSRAPVPASSGSDGDEDFASLFEQSIQQEKRRPARPIAAGDRIACRVIAVGESSVFVAVGEKAEGTIDIAEFRDPGSGELRVAVGDEVQATVVDDGSRNGSAVLTRMLGRGGHAAAELEQAHALGAPVEGVVAAETKGGYEVRFGAVRAFCPGSHIDLRRGERVPAAAYVGQRFAFRVIKVENEGRNVVVSRRALLEEEEARRAEETWRNIHAGAELEGTVRSIRDFGVFVDLGGVDGMVHISELSHARIKHPSDAVSVGQRVRVKVLRVDDEAAPGRRQIALSLRALAEDPWQSATSRFPAGTRTQGVVTRVEQYGAFVEIAPGVEGLVHVSKMALDRRLSHARQAATAGQAVDVTVLSVDPATRRISLSMVEKDLEARDAEAAEDRRDQERVLTEQGERRSLGTLGDLLDAVRRNK